MAQRPDQGCAIPDRSLFRPEQACAQGRRGRPRRAPGVPLSPLRSFIGRPGRCSGRNKGKIRLHPASHAGSLRSGPVSATWVPMGGEGCTGVVWQVAVPDGTGVFSKRLICWPSISSPGTTAARRHDWSVFRSEQLVGTGVLVHVAGPGRLRLRKPRQRDRSVFRPEQACAQGKRGRPRRAPGVPLSPLRSFIGRPGRCSARNRPARLLSIPSDVSRRSVLQSKQAVSGRANLTSTSVLKDRQQASADFCIGGHDASRLCHPGPVGVPAGTSMSVAVVFMSHANHPRVSRPIVAPTGCYPLSLRPKLDSVPRNTGAHLLRVDGRCSGRNRPVLKAGANDGVRQECLYRLCGLS